MPHGFCTMMAVVRGVCTPRVDVSAAHCCPSRPLHMYLSNCKPQPGSRAQYATKEGGEWEGPRRCLEVPTSASLLR